jgi:hypothetical protein
MVCILDGMALAQDTQTQNKSGTEGSTPPIPNLYSTFKYVRFKVLMAVILKNTVFWNVKIW